MAMVWRGHVLSDMSTEAGLRRAQSRRGHGTRKSGYDEAL